MLAKVISYGLNGIDGYEVNIEIDINSGLPGIEMVGLPDTAIKESKERVRSAVKNSGFLFPVKKITINLAPANTKKEGSFYDLPLALGILAASEQISYKLLDGIIFIGELSLDGALRKVNGILPILIAAREKGYKKIIIPYENSKEASFLEGIDTFALKNLAEVIEFLNNQPKFSSVEIENIFNLSKPIKAYNNDFKYVKGQSFAKRAMEVAAAGGHNILLIGPPGGGKTMMAKCIPSILPDLTITESLETTKIHSIMGKLDENTGIINHRPFRSPHHTASSVSLTGGGPNAKPGEISLAHNGVLFLDELLEYNRSVLEVLRQPLEDKCITVSRSAKSVIYPADFMLVASMNPCPCGNFGSKTNECSCTPAQVSKYLSKLSGPLLDRIDIHIEVDNISYDDLSSEVIEEPSCEIKKRADKARKIQTLRYENSGIKCNANMNSEALNKYCALDEKSEKLMKAAFEKLGLSARAYSKILKVARTIADLENKENIMLSHLSEAISFRTLDRSYWK